MAVIAYADGAQSARSSPETVAGVVGAAAIGEGETDGMDTGVLMGWTPEDRPWLSSPSLRGRTVMAGYALAVAVAKRRMRYLPVRLSAMGSLLSEALRPDVAVVVGVRRGEELVFGGSVGWGPAAARNAGSVVVEVDEAGADLGGPPIPGPIVAIVERPYMAAAPPAPRRPDQVELRIGRNVVQLLPDDPTLQFGPGGIAEAIIASLDSPVGIWSGLVTDAVAALAERGLLKDVATAAYTWGSAPLERLHADGGLRLRPVEETHDPAVPAGIPRLVAYNTALQVGLDGSVNVEKVGRRWVAGIGGHADFCAGAARSPGGVSIIALRSTTKTGMSTIVPSVEVTSTPRCDVEVVVTEHGVADLRGLDDGERAERIAAIAALEHRDSLRAAAANLGPSS